MIHRLLACALAGAVAAQVQTTAYVQTSPVGTFGNVAPLGCNPTGLFAEARSQILIPARYLPGPGAVLLGLGALGTSSAGTNTSLRYASLRITVSPTTATTLGPSFASNLPTPHVLLAVNGLDVNWRAGAFTPITFVNTYTHDGASSLVIDIQKVVDPIGDAGHKTIQNARRTDLPRMINAFGGAGSGAHVAQTATATNNAPISLELRWAGAGGTFTPTVKLASEPTAPFRAPFGIGRAFTATLEAAPGALFGTFESPTLFSAPVAIPGVSGLLWLDSPVLVDIGLVPPAGAYATSQTVPDAPELVGLHLAFQALVIEQPAGPWRLTNVADCVVSSGN